MPRYRFVSALALMTILGGASSGCGSSSTTVLSPTPLAGRCGVTLDVSSSSIGAAGGAGILRIQTERECPWRLPQQPPWVKLSQPATSQGPAEVAFVVDENRSTSVRSWEMVVADQRVLISQDAAICTWSVSPAKISIGATGGDAQAVVTTEDFCSWEVPPPAPWIAITPDRGQGTAEITVRVSRNTGRTRTEKVNVASAAIEVAQREAPPPPPGSPAPVPPVPVPPAPLPPAPAPPAPPAPGPEPPPAAPTIPQEAPEVPPAPAPPCTYAVTPDRFTLSHKKQRRKIEVATMSHCQWSATSNASWVRVGSDTRTGSGAAELKVDDYSRSATRSAVVTIAGQNFTKDVTVTQQGEEEEEDEEDEEDEEEEED